MPLLFVDVNLGLGKVERIVVHEGERAEDVAMNFARLHSKEQASKRELMDSYSFKLYVITDIDSDTMRRFKEILDVQISNILSRIDEEEMLS